MIVLVAALVLFSQSMTEAELIAEGEDVGRSAVALGTCSSMGYQADMGALEAWASDYGRRAAAAGWAEDTMTGAMDTGSRLETSELDLTVPTHIEEAEAFRAAVYGIRDRIKVRCRRLNSEHSGLISNMDEGDRTTDAQVEIWLKPLNPSLLIYPTEAFPDRVEW